MEHALRVDGNFGDRVRKSALLKQRIAQARALEQTEHPANSSTAQIAIDQQHPPALAGKRQREVRCHRRLAVAGKRARHQQHLDGVFSRSESEVGHEASVRFGEPEQITRGVALLGKPADGARTVIAGFDRWRCGSRRRAEESRRESAGSLKARDQAEDRRSCEGEQL